MTQKTQFSSSWIFFFFFFYFLYWKSGVSFNTAFWNTLTRLSSKKVNVKWSRYRPGVAQSVGKVIALLFHDRDTRRGWVVSSTPRPHFTPGKDQVPILQEAGWAPGPVWTGGKSRPHRDSIPDRPSRSQSLYRLSYPAHTRISSTCDNSVGLYLNFKY